MKPCSSGKKIYVQEAIAEDMLIELWSKNDYAPNQGPVAIYKCDDCGYYHHTSKGPINPKLSELLQNGTINRMREANRWSDKFKKY
jgi:ABC-type ATPase with predicted acetyltransferase domain